MTQYLKKNNDGLLKVIKISELDNIGIKMDGKYLKNHSFADDVALRSESGKNLQLLIGEPHLSSEDYYEANKGNVE